MKNIIDTKYYGKIIKQTNKKIYVELFDKFYNNEDIIEIITIQKMKK